MTVKTLDDAIGGTPALLLSGAEPLEKNFTITEIGNRHGLEWVKLVPKAQDTGFEEMLLAFGQDDLEAMELNDSFGQKTRLVFSNTERNPALEPSLFTFEPPEGVDVIGAAQSQDSAYRLQE